MDELTPGTRAILQAMHEEDSPSDAEFQRVRSRVLTRIGAGIAVGGATVATTQTAAAALTTGAVIKGSLFASLVVGAGVLVMTMAQPPASEVAPVEHHQIVELPQTVESVPEPTVSDEVHGEDPAVEEPVVDEPVIGEIVGEDEPPPVQRAAKSTSPRLSRTSSALGEEALLLSKAHGALRSGKSQAAIQFLNEHQQRFPAGSLRLERDAALAIAHCQGGNRSAGLTRAKAFRRAHPDSPMIGRLEAACGLPPP